MATDLLAQSLKEPVDVAEYLFRRLHQIGIRSVHGVPGDYNLVALDYIPKTDLRWVGNVNELNAGYAADGYARVKGIAAMVTTFGVGELSTLNAIAGAYSEYVPVIHIVGTPSTVSQKNGMLLHHTLGNGDFRVFANMSENISCVVSRLEDPATAAALIDHAIRECYLQSRPAYITLPTDMVQKKVEGARLQTPLDLSYPQNPEEKENYVVDVIIRSLKASKKPVILVDACTIRHRATSEVHDLVAKSSLPTFVTPMGKGAVDETLPNYGGVYAGDGSNTGVREQVEDSDLILSFGAIKSDFNTAGFSYRTSQLASIDFHSNLVRVRYSEYPGVRMNGVIRKVLTHLDGPSGALAHIQPPSNLPRPRDTALTAPNDTDAASTEPITHEWFWPHLTPFMRAEDIVVTETGTSGYGIWEVLFQPGTIAISQILWGSIGYAFGALQGAALAAADLAPSASEKNSTKRRTILFTGDGSFQLTAQELSTLIRHKLTPIVFILCNKGYTIERFIHGMDASYNDIGDWRYVDLPAAFGAHKGSFRTYQARTRQEALQLLADPEFAKAEVLQVVELHMPWDDAPKALKLTAEASAKNNAKQ